MQSLSSVMALIWWAGADVAAGVVARLAERAGVGFMGVFSVEFMPASATFCAQAESITQANNAAPTYHRAGGRRHSNEGVKTGMQLSKM